MATDCSNEVCGPKVLKKFIEFYWLRSLMIIAGESSRCVWFVRTLELAMLGRTLNIIPFEIIIQWFTRIAIGTYFVRRPTDGWTDAATTTELSKYVDLWFKLVLIKLPYAIQCPKFRHSFPKMLETFWRKYLTFGPPQKFQSYQNCRIFLVFFKRGRLNEIKIQPNFEKKTT